MGDQSVLILSDQTVVASDLEDYFTRKGAGRIDVMRSNAEAAAALCARSLVPSLAFIANDWNEDVEICFAELMKLGARVIAVDGERSSDDAGRVVFLARPFIDLDVDHALRQLGFSV